MPRLTVCALNAKSKAVLSHQAQLKAVSFDEHEEALAYCRKEKCKAKKCLKQNPGRWKHVTVDKLEKRLSGQVRNGREFEYKMVLTGPERDELADAMRMAAAYGEPMTKGARDDAVCDILWYRTKMNKAGGRSFTKLSQAALKCLKNRHPGPEFWQGFFANPSYSDLVRKNQVSTLNPHHDPLCSPKHEAFSQFSQKTAKTPHVSTS